MTPDTAYELEKLRREVARVRTVAWLALAVALAAGAVAAALGVAP